MIPIPVILIRSTMARTEFPVKRIPHYAPVNEPGTWLLNIAKRKAHSMGSRSP
jgi:hypothetical protein